MKDVDGMRYEFYGSPHGTFIGQVPWVTSKGKYLLGLLHGIRSIPSRDITTRLGGTQMYLRQAPEH